VRTLEDATCLSGNIPQATPVGTLISRTEAVTPALGQARYYLVGHNPVPNVPVGTFASLGRRSDGSVRMPPGACP
jgi:hypothetical protein